MVGGVGGLDQCGLIDYVRQATDLLGEHSSAQELEANLLPFHRAVSIHVNTNPRMGSPN